MRTKSLVSIGMITFGFLPAIEAAQPDSEARSKLVATTQPSGEQTLINIIMIEFTPTSQATTPKDVRKQMSEQATVEAGLKVLESIGKVEVLSRPSIIVKWPQSAEMTVGTRVPIKNGDKTVYEDIGLKLSLEGQWLEQVDPERAYLRLNVDHGYIASESPQAAARVLHQQLKKERIITQGKTAWFTLPKNNQDNSGPLNLIGLTAHRVSPEPGHR